MPDKLIIIAEFPDAAAAQRAKGRLAAVGIKAFLVDPPRYAQADGSMDAIRLRVSERQAEEARTILAAPDLELTTQRDFKNAVKSAIPSRRGDELLEEEERTLNEREKNAQRALFASIGGLFFFPFLIYACFLMLQVWTSPEPLSHDSRRKAWFASVVVGLFVGICVLFFFLIVLNILGLLPQGRPDHLAF